MGLLGCGRRWGHGAHVVSGTAVGMPCGGGMVVVLFRDGKSPAMSALDVMGTKVVQ